MRDCLVKTYSKGMLKKQLNKEKEIRTYAKSIFRLSYVKHLEDFEKRKAVQFAGAERFMPSQRSQIR